MRRRVLAALCVLCSMLAADSAAAQGRSAAPATAGASSEPSVTGDSAERLLAGMRARLRGLVVAQEGYYAKRGTYTTDLAALDMLPTPEARRAGPVLAVIFAGGRGWTALATDRRLRGLSCVVFVGGDADVPRLPATAGDGLTPTEEGEPRCDATP
jgi:hypothetical protein